MPITVLMPVRDGAPYLQQQLDSLAQQETPPARLLVSDDGSTDETAEIIRKFSRTAPFDVSLTRQALGGYAKNVADLIRRAPAGAIAFCDQDDIWRSGRLTRATDALRGWRFPTLHVTARQPFQDARPPSRPIPAPHRIDFRSALIRNGAPANATVLNPAAASLVKTWLPPSGRLPVFPDWWIYALVLGSGGQVSLDSEPGVLYRQHPANLLGARRGLGWIRRMGMLADGTYGNWLRTQSRALLHAAAALTLENRILLNRFARRLERHWLCAALPPLVMNGSPMYEDNTGLKHI